MKNARGANYKIVSDLPGIALLIQDVGPWDAHLSVTNDAENVILTLVAQGRLPAGRRLFYFDSDGQLDELLIKDGLFAGFAPGPRPQKCRVCGCTEDRACPGGCSWVAVDLCSACAEKGPEA
jgi:hypothetical protein